MREETTSYSVQAIRVPDIRTRCTCDRCGISVLDPPNGEFSEIIIALDEEQCVYSRCIRDYCASCAGTIWAQLSAIVGADPTVVGDDRP